MVRWLIVAGSPTAGGFAGYFTNGTSTMPSRAAPARPNAARVSLEVRSRRRSNVYAVASNPPIATPYRAVARNSPPFWPVRETSSSSW
jgi:hypothetical protein